MEEANQFDIEKYSHLSTETPLEIWVAEFLSRNPEFKAIYKEMVSCPKEERMRYHHVLFRKFNVGISLKTEIELSTGERFKAELPPAISSLRITDDQDVLNHFRRKQSSITHKKDFMQSEFWYRDMVKAGLFSSKRTDCTPEEIVDAVLDEKDEDDHYSVGDVLILAIKLNRKRSEIDDRYNELLRAHFPEPRSGGKKSEENISKWKYYLMVYDLRLRMRDQKWDDIGEKLKGYCPELMSTKARNTHIFDEERNVKSYFDKAEKLITCGYKKYF